MSLANVSVVGNLVRDPELFQFESGRKKASFHVAVNGYDRSTKEKFAEYYKIETWDRLAELACQYLRKGNQVTVVGRLILERWQDKSGKERCAPLVYASQLSLPRKTENQKMETQQNEGSPGSQNTDSMAKEIQDSFSGVKLKDEVEKESAVEKEDQNKICA